MCHSCSVFGIEELLVPKFNPKTNKFELELVDIRDLTQEEKDILYKQNEFNLDYKAREE